MALPNDPPAIKELAATLKIAVRKAENRFSTSFLIEGYLDFFKDDLRDLSLMQMPNYHALDAKQRAIKMINSHFETVCGLCTEIKDPTIYFFGDCYVRDFLAPVLRIAACRNSLDNALTISLGRLDTDNLSEDSKLLLLRVFGEQIYAPYLTINELDKMHMLVVSMTLDLERKNMEKKNFRLKIPALTIKSGLFASLLRLICAPVRPGLSKQDYIDYECSRNEWAHWVTLTLSILLAELPATKAAPLIAQVETEILAASPWIWHALERLGCEWDMGAEGGYCFAHICLLMLVEVSTKVHAAATGAGGEQILSRICNNFFRNNPQKAAEKGETLMQQFRQAAIRGRLKLNLVDLCVKHFHELSSVNSQRMVRRKSLSSSGIYGEVPTASAVEEMRRTGEEAAAQSRQQMRQGRSFQFPPSSSSNSQPQARRESPANNKSSKKTTAASASTSAPKKTFKAGSCGYCGISASVLDRKLQLCSGCKVQRYCSAQCQKDDWPHHKKACKEAQRKEAAG